MADDNLQGLIDIRRELQNGADALKTQAALAGRLGEEFNGVFNLSKKLTSALTAGVEAQADSNNLIDTYKKSLKSVNELKRQQNIIQDALTSKVNSLNTVEKKALDQARQSLANIKAREVSIKGYREQIAAAGNNLTLVAQLSSDIRDAEKDINKESKKYDRAIKDKNVLMAVFLEMQKESVDKAVELNEVHAKNILGFNNMFKIAAKNGDKLWKDMGKGMLGALGLSGGIAGMFNSMLTAAFSIDKSLTNITKNSGLTRDATDALSKDYMETVKSVNALNSGLNTALLTHLGMLEAQTQLQASTDQFGLFTKQNVLTQMSLTKQYGLQAEEAAKLNQVGLISGKTTKETTDILFEQTVQLNKANGTRFKGVEILKAVSKIEGVLAVNYKNNPKLIAQAVLQAKALGLSLEQAARASSSLLDFESSISNELEVELLTGKRWNLEKARSLALDGKSAEAMQEMMKNVGTLADYEKLNVIAKESAARALGMSSDELSNALRSQELMKNVSKETLQAIKESGNSTKYMSMLNASTNAEQMKAAEGRVEKQLEFEASMERVKGQLAILASGPLMKMVDGVVKLTENATALKVILSAAAGLMAAMAVSSAIMAVSSVIATGGLTALLSAGGILAAGGLAAYGVGSVLTSPTKSVNDSLINPSGQIMISTPEGMIKPNKNDSVITTTNPSSLLSGGNGGSGKQEQLLAAILNAVQQPGGVYMDTNKVGTSLGMKYSSYA